MYRARYLDFTSHTAEKVKRFLSCGWMGLQPRLSFKLEQIYLAGFIPQLARGSLVLSVTSLQAVEAQQV